MLKIFVYLTLCDLHMRLDERKSDIVAFKQQKADSAEQHAHPHSLISAFVIRCLLSIIVKLAMSKISIFKLASVAEQAGLSIRPNKKYLCLGSSGPTYIYW